MNKSTQIYKESYETEEQRSIEFNEYPELEKYYTSRKKSEKKPTKIILTEIYSPNKTYMKSNNYFNQSKSYKNINGNNEEIHSYMKKNHYAGNNINPIYADSPSQLNIKKRIYCNSVEKTKTKDDKDFLENFKYYERRNIRDNSNQKYESITKVIGYSNLIPLKNQRTTQNISNTNINLNEFKNYKNSQNNNIKGSNYLISNTNKKIEKNYMIKKETVAKNQQNVKKEFKKPAQLDNNKRSQITKKYEITKKQEIKTNKTIDYKQYERKKKEEVKNNNITQTKKYNIQIKKNETQKSVNNLNKYKKTEKKEIKEPIIIKRKENIKQEFTYHSGRYSYKDNITNDIINSRKNYNENSQEKNLKRISIVQTSSKSKSANKNKTNENKATNKNYKININTNNKYKKEETTKKTGVNITNKININANMSNYKRKGNETNKIQTNIKSNINIKKESYGKIDMNKYKREKKEEKEKVNIKEMNKIFETKIKNDKKRNQTPTLKKINFGDNYRFYESKYLLYPDDSCITVHHLRSKNIIEEGNDFDIGDLSNYKAYKSKPFILEKKYENQINCYSNGVNDDYENEDYYIEQDREYCY